MVGKKDGRLWGYMVPYAVYKPEFVYEGPKTPILAYTDKPYILSYTLSDA